jgi:hypothetical protein
MTFHLSGRSGCATVLLVLFVPAILTAYFMHSAIWLIAIPLAIIVIALLVAALPIKRKVTPEQFAEELEKHLLGTEGPWDWDDTTSVAIADERLEQVRGVLSKFDSLASQEDKDALKAIVEALRRGEIPDVHSSANKGHDDHGFIRLHLKD